MLDASHDGFIQSDDFLNGCLRLDGPAKAIDLAAFIEESRKVNRTFLEHALCSGLSCAVSHRVPSCCVAPCLGSKARFVSQTLGWLVHATEANAQHHSALQTPKE